MKKRLLCLLIALLILSTMAFACCQRKQEEETDDKPQQTVLPKAEKPSIAIHYKRTDGDYERWGYWLWVQGADGKIFQHNGLDEFGGIAYYSLDEIGAGAMSKGIGLIPRRIDNDDWIKDGNSDRLIDFSNYEMDENNYYHIYIKQGDENLYTDANLTIPEMVTSATFMTTTKVGVIATAKLTKIELLEDGVSIASADVSSKTGKVLFPEGKSANIEKQYAVAVTFESGKTATATVAVNSLYSTVDFNNNYTYDGNDLGAIVSNDNTTFKVWSPVASRITLNLYAQGDTVASYKNVEMERAEKGVWFASVNENLAGRYYTYTVYNSKYPDGAEIVDPYAKSAGLNGNRGMVVDFSVTNPEGWADVTVPSYDRKELVVWETHVADMTSSSTWTGTEANRKKFLGMAEGGTTYTANGKTVKTGFDHVVELGVNAIQIIPIFDQANNESNVTFNWGYNPHNYNVLEGAYSSNPRDGYARIKEFKQVVQAYNNAGIGVIMDVVYNHTNSCVGNNFDVLMPGYYYRYDAKGTVSSGSGCGNDTASENYMFRKFMIDSVCFWAQEYKLMGFRFDLMGLHDVETMNQLTEALKKINPNIVVYGEPWDLTTKTNATLATQANGNLYRGFGQFNDRMRDGLIKGGMNPTSAKGWVTGAVGNGDMDSILGGLKGLTIADGIEIKDPDKTVNYVTCHDNYTLYDRIKAAGIKDEATVKKMAMLANSVVLTSNGTTFILAGEEFLRTKGGDHNSYQSSYKVNELNYALKIIHYDMFENYQKLIALKKTATGLHLEKGDVVLSGDYKASASNNNGVITVEFDDATTGRHYKIVHVNGAGANATANFESYTLYLDTIGGATLSASTTLSAYQTIIAYK